MKKGLLSLIGVVVLIIGLPLILWRSPLATRSEKLIFFSAWWVVVWVTLTFTVLASLFGESPVRGYVGAALLSPALLVLLWDREILSD